MHKLTLSVMPGEYAVARFAPTATLPASLWEAPGLVSVSHTEGELSVIAPAGILDTVFNAPQLSTSAQRIEPGWRLLTVRGPLSFTLSGIMAALTGELAAAGVPLFALSTFDTDHLLIKENDLDRAVDALRAASHNIA